MFKSKTSRRIRTRWIKNPVIGIALWLHPKRWPPLWEARWLLREKQYDNAPLFYGPDILGDDKNKLGRQNPKIEVF